MAKREYGQYCGAARALDVLGDRWTLLLVRELLVSPCRYTDLQHNLPGIGSNLLAQRLEELRSHGVIEKAQLPPPAASTVYRLTERGRALEPVIVELARWGMELLGQPDPEQAWRPGWSILAMRAVFRPEAASGVHEAYQFIVDDEPFWAAVDDGKLETGLGEHDDPAVTVRTDAASLLAVAAGELDADEAIAAGRYVVTGDVEALERCGKIFDLASRSSA